MTTPSHTRSCTTPVSLYSVSSCVASTNLIPPRTLRSIETTGQRKQAGRTKERGHHAGTLQSFEHRQRHPFATFVDRVSSFYWTRTSREEQAAARTEILQALRNHHALSNDSAAHPTVGFNLPAWNGDARFSAAALLGNPPAWALA